MLDATTSVLYAPLGRYALSLVQGGAVAWIIVATYRAIRRLDELQQRIQFESIAIAFAATAIAVTSYGFLEEAGLPRVKWGIWIWPFMSMLWWLGILRVRRRH